MRNNAAPDPGWLNDAFYKAAWNWVKEDIFSLVTNFYTNVVLPIEINQTYISLMVGIGPIFWEVDGKLDWVENSMLTIQLRISIIRTPATTTPLLRWLSTEHNLIDLSTKAFPCKWIENTRKKVKHAIW
jgi:hypothetical protein